jgi:hypothetical protein
MKVRCPDCLVEADLGPRCDDLTDIRYRLQCPVIRAARGPEKIIDCPRFGPLILAAVLKSRRRRAARRK